ncbi:MAG TPA: 2-dehydropantoate 2-reductase N-terminal domain-containing protein [Kofleriaceae bacterium]|nr:2-dehydropantoate 2-reductase N-terminal domain-containing protein [Kofleriaceae bacterium]
MRLVVIGIGAIGGVIGGFVARAGGDVVLVARGAQLAAIRAGGLRVDTPGGSFSVAPPVVATPAEVDWRPGDLAVIAVKTQDLAPILIELAAVAPGVPVACMTNGLEAERLAVRWVGEVVAGCVMLPGTYLEPGVVQAWAAPGPGAIDLGAYPDGGGRLAAELAHALGAAGFDCQVRADIQRWKRGKLLSNLGNGAEALCGRGARQTSLVERARREAIACFEAAGLSFVPADEYAARNTATAAQPIGDARRAGGSTWQSLARGGSLETDYLNGEVVLLGRLHGVATPVNAMLQRVASDATRRGERPGARTIAELEALVADA